jgi:transcriptional regulator with XRE-family HTH domain
MGPAIRILRERRGLGQREAASLRGNFDQSRWSKIERGAQSPSLQVLDSFLEVLDASLFDLMDALLGKDVGEEEVCEHLLVAHRLGDLNSSEKAVVQDLIRSHRESLVRILEELRKGQEQPDSDSDS